jgi:hypothetical protein
MQLNSLLAHSYSPEKTAHSFIVTVIYFILFIKLSIRISKLSVPYKYFNIMNNIKSSLSVAANIIKQFRKVGKNMSKWICR